MNKPLILLASLAVFSTTAAAEGAKGEAAQGQPGAGAPDQQAAEQLPPEREQISMKLEFAQLDQDGDGVVTRDEFERAVTQQWQQVDMDSDGRIDEAEFAAFIYKIEGREPSGADTMMGGGDGVPPD